MLIENCTYICTKGKCIAKSSGGGGSGNSPTPSETKNIENETIPDANEYFLHENISVTIFWIGEEASEENNFISNNQSAWDNNWTENYGGIDNPNNRTNYFPSDFTPLENPFYFALPYNDFNNGIRRENTDYIYWAREKSWDLLESMCKNQWIKIIKGNNTAYAQWEDVGPFEVNDSNYVFGESLPKNEINENAGLDISPAVRDFLNLEDIEKVDWQFINFSEVPEGPWKEIITTSQISWN
jgi:hypothetical protein